MFQRLPIALARVKASSESYKNNTFKISAPTWNEELELRDGSYSVLYIQSDFEYIFKKID